MRAFNTSRLSLIGLLLVAWDWMLKVFSGYCVRSLKVCHWGSCRRDRAVRRCY